MKLIDPRPTNAPRNQNVLIFEGCDGRRATGYACGTNIPLTPAQAKRVSEGIQQEIDSFPDAPKR